MNVHAQCLISIGSNLGNRVSQISAAARIVADSPLVENFTASRLFETPPIGGPAGQAPFLNAIAALDTIASAREILAMLQQTENHLGRQRRHRWDARSIDLDVILHGELMGGGKGLVVPHPRYTARQFVLQPACDVAPNYRDPRFGWTLKRLARHLNEGVASLALVGGDAAVRSEICRRLTEDHQIRTFAAKPSAQPIQVIGSAPLAVSVTGHPSEENELITIAGDSPWVAAFVPPLPSLDSQQTGLARVPRLIARIQRTTPDTCWPAPHQMWPSGWQWPEYRLEVNDLDWAVSEVVSALASMRCPVNAVTEDGNWW